MNCFVSACSVERSTLSVSQRPACRTQYECAELVVKNSTDRSEREDVTGCKRVERHGGVEVERRLYVSTATL